MANGSNKNDNSVPKTQKNNRADRLQKLISISKEELESLKEWRIEFDKLKNKYIEEISKFNEVTKNFVVQEIDKLEQNIKDSESSIKEAYDELKALHKQWDDNRTKTSSSVLKLCNEKLHAESCPQEVSRIMYELNIYDSPDAYMNEFNPKFFKYVSGLKRDHLDGVIKGLNSLETTVLDEYGFNYSGLDENIRDNDISVNQFKLNINDSVEKVKKSIKQSKLDHLKTLGQLAPGVAEVLNTRIGQSPLELVDDFRNFCTTTINNYKSKLKEDKSKILEKYKNETNKYNIGSDSYNQILDNDNVTPNEFEEQLKDIIQKAKDKLKEQKNAHYLKAVKETSSISVGKLDPKFRSEIDNDAESVDDYKKRLDAAVLSLKEQQKFDNIQKEFDESIEQIKEVDPKSGKEFEKLAREIFSKDYSSDKDGKAFTDDIAKLEQMITEFVEEVTEGAK